MPDNHIDQEIDDIDENALLRSMGIMVPRHKIVSVESEAEKNDHTDGLKIDRNKKATSSKYENIARRVKEIWQQHGFGPGEDQRAWHGVLSDIKSMITPLPDIESTRSKVKRLSPAERSKPNQSESETTPELKHEPIDEQVEQICQQQSCEPSKDQQNRTGNEGSDVNKNETETTPELVPELTFELIAERAKQIWQQRGCRSGEDEQNWAEAERQLKQELNID